jgi:phospholipid/cholesterol/gamma-HCH transport system ATP-binding protein
MQPIITVHDLSAGFGDTLILKEVEFDVLEGEILVILGASGCGKTTLLKQMIGLYTPLSGRIIIDGLELTGCDEQTYHRILRKIGVMYQAGALFGSMTLADNVMLPILEYTDLDEQAARELAYMKLGMVNLGGAEHLLPSEISGGMRKRAGIARAMALNPRIIFFDELSAGLDPITSAELDALVLGLNANMGTTMVVVSHELPSIFAIAHRVIMLDKSTHGIIAQGDPRELQEHSTNPLVRRFFNREPESGKRS